MAAQQDELAELRAYIDKQIASVREESKELQPSVIGAVRTLMNDGLAWHRGERDLPRAALIGLASAYLRPRLILVVGSLAAAIIAIAQIWLIKGQNEILSEQSRLIKAQTVGTIVQELRKQDPASISSSALISAFGDVSFDVVSNIVLVSPPVRADLTSDVTEELNAWTNAALIVSHGSQSLTATEAIRFRHNLVAQTVLIRTGIGKLIREIERNSPVPTSLKETHEHYQACERIIAAIVADLDSSHPIAGNEYSRSLTANERSKIVQGMVAYYRDMPLTGITRSIITPRLDRTLSAICRHLNGHQLRDGLYKHLLVAHSQMRSTNPPLDDHQITALIITKWCGDVPNEDQYVGDLSMFDKVPNPE